MATTMQKDKSAAAAVVSKAKKLRDERDASVSLPVGLSEARADDIEEFRWMDRGETKLREKLRNAKDDLAKLRHVAETDALETKAREDELDALRRIHDGKNAAKKEHRVGKVAVKKEHNKDKKVKKEKKMKKKSRKSRTGTPSSCRTPGVTVSRARSCDDDGKVAAPMNTAKLELENQSAMFKQGYADCMMAMKKNKEEKLKENAEVDTDKSTGASASSGFPFEVEIKLEPFEVTVKSKGLKLIAMPKAEFVKTSAKLENAKQEQVPLKPKVKTDDETPQLAKKKTKEPVKKVSLVPRGKSATGSSDVPDSPKMKSEAKEVTSSMSRAASRARSASRLRKRHLVDKYKKSDLKLVARVRSPTVKLRPRSSSRTSRKRAVIRRDRFQ
jgi:hypothetical protein